jgi:hypothetical protein
MIVTLVPVFSVHAKDADLLGPQEQPVESGRLPDWTLQIPLFLAKTGVYLRGLAKVEKGGKIVENLGKNRLFMDLFGASVDPVVAGSTPVALASKASSNPSA